MTAAEWPVPLVKGPTDYYPEIPGPRNALLDMLAGTRSFYVEFYDPDGLKFGPVPVGAERLAHAPPAARQGSASGGQLQAGQIIWKHRGKRRRADLYLESLALLVRPMTHAKWRAVGLALLARMTCPACGTAKEYCIPTSIGMCNDCAAGSGL